MTVQVPIRLPDQDVAALDAAIARGRFPNRSEALRRGLALLMREEREREIEEAYRRGYGMRPQEAAVGKAGLALLAESVRREEEGKELL